MLSGVAMQSTGLKKDGWRPQVGLKALATPSSLAGVHGVGMAGKGVFMSKVTTIAALALGLTLAPFATDPAQAAGPGRRVVRRTKARHAARKHVRDHRQGPAPTEGRRLRVRDRLEDVKDRREDHRDRREDVRDRKEDRRDRREDVRDRKEDRVDRRHDGGIRDRLEDIRDRAEDRRDRREDVRDRKEDRVDRREDVQDRLEDRRDARD